MLVCNRREAPCPRGRTYESVGAATANHHRDGALRQRTRILPVREGGEGRAASFGSLGGRNVPRLCLGLWGWLANLGAPWQLPKSLLSALSACPQPPLLSCEDPNCRLILLGSICKDPISKSGHIHRDQGLGLGLPFGGRQFNQPQKAFWGSKSRECQVLSFSCQIEDGARWGGVRGDSSSSSRRRRCTRCRPGTRGCHRESRWRAGP